MKEAIVQPDISVTLVDSTVPKPGPDDVLIKVIVSGSNPKDWKIPLMRGNAHNTGDDIAGTVEEVGANITEFRKGDRVAAFHVMTTPHGSYAEYAIAPANTTFHLPAKTSFEEGAAIPLAAMTAAIGLFIRLDMPEPWKQGRENGRSAEGKGKVESGPLLVYGAASAVGAYVIQLAKHAGVGPIIAVAGHGIPFVEAMLDKSAGDAVIDYRKGDAAVVAGIKAALPAGTKLRHCYDAVSEHNSYVNASQVLEPTGGSRITLVLPGKDYSAIPTGIEHSTTMVADAHGKQTDFAYAWFRLFSKGLREGWFKPHPHEVIKGGLAGVEEGLKNLKDGKASAIKYVFRIAETPGLSS